MPAFQFKVELRQQTPLIHFQHRQEGACLRASEVKPKLDAFLKARFEERLSSFYISGTVALDYKMRVEAEGDAERSTTIEAALLKIDGRATNQDKLKQNINDNNRIIICRSYFGNMVSGENDNEKKQNINEMFKETVFYISPIGLIFFCRYPDLSKLIKENIALFFLLYNFGTRQNKGFGSFKVTEIDGAPVTRDAFDLLKEGYKPTYQYLYKYKYNEPQTCANGNSHQAQMEAAACIYQLMKSGKNYEDKKSNRNMQAKIPKYKRAYIFKHMQSQDKNIGNEKAWMKQNGIAPVVCDPKRQACAEHLPPYTYKKYRYVRAMLGLTDEQRYFACWDKVQNKAAGRKNIKISHVAGTIKRFPSPVFFKIVDNCLFILANEPADDMYCQEFEFDGLKRGTLMTPNKEEFSMKTFLSEFSADFLTLKDAFPSLPNGVKLEEVACP